MLYINHTESSLSSSLTTDEYRFLAEIEVDC